MADPSRSGWPAPASTASISPLARPSKSEPIRLTLEALDDLEEEIELLKVAFERYFNGVDRVPPTREHDTVKLHIRNAERQRSASTLIRFRMQGLKARFITYEHYWTRILRQIEDGSFKRVVAESKRRELEALRRRVEEDGSERSGVRTMADRDPGQSGIRAKLDRDGESGLLEQAEPARARPPLPSAVDPKQARELFKQFVAAKKAAGESVEGLTYGRLLDKLSREVPKLQELHGDGLRLEVATVDGKVRLRARKQPTGQKAS
jgi:hypothetical protein